ncbi:MAG: hypothetical protein A2W03_13440 [Candidatus Aminicenantes bacterium RBG_16_63_16]|nr:MAG: hypothetical protein A2W03_13440 [Candidatus Aminicenantes bacterium RBG_16_63_16]
MTVRARILLAVSVLALLTPAAGQMARDIPFSNTILVYADPGRDWNAGGFEYYLAYVDKDGRPRDRLFDGFLFLAINAPSKRNFWDGKAGAADWDWWLERIFEPGRQLDALEGDARALESRLGPAAPRKVIISIPRPPVDADAAGQEAVVKDFVDRCVRRFGDKAYRRVALDGFYWFHEGVDGTNAGLVNSLSQDLRSRGLRLYWIPYDVGHENRAHLLKWRMGSLRFDGVWLQPNYFWAERNEKYAAQDLDDTVSFARSMSAQVEVEFDRGAYSTGWKLGRYNHYLISADVYGYRNGPLMYYDGYLGYIKCGQSRNPVQRAVYDDLYWFTRKAYLPKPMTYPAVFFETGSAADPAAHPEIGLWIEKGGEEGRLYLVEPDPNKDYLVILKSARKASGKLEALIDGVPVRLEKVKAGSGAGEAGLDRFRLPRVLIQKAWKPKTTLVVALRRTGGGEIREGWARPDDFVFRYLKGKQPMETEMRLEINEATAELRNAFEETVVGLRGAGAAGPGAGFEISDGTPRPRRVAWAPGGGGEFIWCTGKGDREGNLRIRPDPGVEIAELVAFPAGASFHLRPGSCGDTRVDLHIPGVSLIPDGKWRLAGEFGRNYRTDLAGGGLWVEAPRTAKSHNLVLLVEAKPGAPVELRTQSPPAAAARIDPGKPRRISIRLKPGHHHFIFTGPVALLDAWLAPR